MINYSITSSVREHGFRNIKAERLSGFQINDQLEFRGRLHWQVGWIKLGRGINILVLLDINQFRHPPQCYIILVLSVWRRAGMFSPCLDSIRGDMP